MPSLDKQSSVDRVVNERHLENEALKHHRKLFDDQKIDFLKPEMEREKTPAEKEIIRLVNEFLNKIRQQCGLQNFEVSENNVHIIKNDRWKALIQKVMPELQGSDVQGFFQGTNEAAILKEQQSILRFADALCHEITHFHSYGSLQLVRLSSEMDKHEKNFSSADYRRGLGINNRLIQEQDAQKSKLYFALLNEAVTEELTVRFLEQNKNNPIFQDGFSKIAEGPKMAYVANESTSDSPKFIVGPFHFEERESLRTLIKKLEQQNTEINQTEIFDLFVKAYFTGNILPLSRLIEKSFGKGTFRKIGEIADYKEFDKFIKSL